MATPIHLHQPGSCSKKSIMLIIRNKSIIHQSKTNFLDYPWNWKRITESEVMKKIHAGNDQCLNILGLFSIHISITLQWEFR